MEEGLCRDEEGSGAHPEQRDELQEPEAENRHRRQREIKVCTIYNYVRLPLEIKVEVNKTAIIHKRSMPQFYETS